MPQIGHKRTHGAPKRRPRGTQKAPQSAKRLNIAAARAVDREFNYNFGSNLGDGRRGAAPPRTQLLFRGARSAPLAAAVVRFLATEPLVRGRTFPRNPTFTQQATCPGRLRCLGQNFFPRNPTFFEQTTCPGQLRCLGQNFFSRIRLFFEQTTCPGHGAELFLKNDFF